MCSFDSDALAGSRGHGGAEPLQVERAGFDDADAAGGQQSETLRIFRDCQRTLGDLASAGRVGEVAALLLRQRIVPRAVDQQQNDAEQMPRSG